jgi:hypothetical protein
LFESDFAECPSIPGGLMPIHKESLAFVHVMVWFKGPTSSYSDLVWSPTKNHLTLQSSRRSLC